MPTPEAYPFARAKEAGNRVLDSAALRDTLGKQQGKP